MGTGEPMDFGRVIEAVAAASPVDVIEAIAIELGRVLEATEVSFLIADLSGRALVRLAHVPMVDDPSALGEGERRSAAESATVLPFDGGPAEQSMRTQTVQVIAPDDNRSEPGCWRLLAPVTERGEAIGLLELSLPREPSARAIEELGQMAHFLAFVVIANRRHTDKFEWGQRTRMFSLSAEIQQRLLPQARSCEGNSFILSGWLEPAASIGGDTFDYNVDRGTLHLSLTDAMGHGVAASLTASVCVGSLRGSRRQGIGLPDQVIAANTAVAEHAARGTSDDFVTGLVGRVDLRTGVLELVNAGHVAPYLARGSEVTEIALRANLPFGMFPDTAYSLSQLQLRPGDRLVFVTDGMLERSLARDDLVSAIRDTAGLHPREVVRGLADRALETTGHALGDDATVLCLDWYGDHHEPRKPVSGADMGRASDPLTPN